MFNPIHSSCHSLDIEGYDLPQQFTFPFYYEPHPLCIKAAQEVQNYLKTQNDFQHNFGLIQGKKGLVIGKMFGVMLIEAPDGSIGYLAGFSGKLGEKNYIKGFVPPIFDTLNTSGFYKKGEEQLNIMNADIEALETSKALIKAKANLEEEKLKSVSELKALKAYLKTQKQERDKKRKEARLNLSPEVLKAYESQLDEESIAFHFKLKHLKADWKERIAFAELNLRLLEEDINALKSKRRTLSAQLQRQLHQSYAFLNAKGEHKDLLDIFETQPPAAAGECAAPKLFQFAYENKLKPLAMAEFWWGSSPKSEVRQHGQFYPSCRGKCEPILGHMLEGLKVEPNPIAHTEPLKGDLDIIYEDDYLLLVNKPSEFLSVPGKTINDSVLTRMQNYLPDAKGPLLVHRLDMSTSGLLLVAKNKKTHKNLQKQFLNRTVKKKYIAILDGIINANSGVIDLPLRVDLNNRPTQLVCYDYGKKAVTKYEVIKTENGKTLVHFYPITGRTHQLRVHAAHHKGLRTPILGDDLYGRRHKRLHLHAESLSFEHPVSKKHVLFTSECPF
ncbi:RluA family pseudouridine synthase [Winogradskyella aurantia]|uniref:RNA pseudouridine synthase n=1 Tax=Winogradskyella aurantia TaxID=1915063 RepID=A0A265UMW8_9FLAO|nr:RluA family pseudouridine synthase [Winogradskyella aurantia]OZV66609.1 RNA pseudouridine synthase [Winogradskyella aurantia]